MFNPERLKEIMKTKNMKAEHLAKAIEMDSSNISALLKGRIKNPKIEFLGKIANALDVTVSELTGEIEPKEQLENSIYELEDLITNYQEYFRLIKKIKDNKLDLRIVEAYVDGLINK